MIKCRILFSYGESSVFKVAEVAEAPTRELAFSIAKNGAIEKLVRHANTLIRIAERRQCLVTELSPFVDPVLKMCARRIAVAFVEL